MPPKRSSGQQGREKGLDGDEDDVGASSFATSSTTLPTPSMSRQQSSTASSGPPASSSPPGQTSSSSHSSSHEPLPAHFTGDPKTISQNQKDQLIEWLRTHRVNTITELRRIEKIFAFLDSAEVTEPMISAWAHYVNSNNLLNELRGLTKRFPFSSECLDEAKQLVLAEPATVRSWNYCWLVLTKMERENLVIKHARALASRESTWGGRTPTPVEHDRLVRACSEDWTRAVRHLLRHWDQDP